MFKYLVFIGVSFVCLNVNAQADLSFYKVHPLHLTDLSKAPANPEIDFGYNSNLDKEQAIFEGYYLWIQDHWYSIVNAKELFKVNPVSPIFFSLNKINKKDLEIKDASGVVYAYPLESIDTYHVSKDVYDKEVYTFKELPPVVYTPVVPLEPQSAPIDEFPVNDVLDLETISVVEIEDDEKKDTISTTEIVDDVIVEEVSKPVVETKKENVPMNAYEKAVAAGFEGTVTEWIESVDSLGGKSAYEQAKATGFSGTEAEWMRTLWGSETDPEIERQNKTAGIVTQWIKELNLSKGNTPYELALKHGFYGTYTEWIESVIGSEGEEAYNKDISEGYSGSYKSWIESKLKTSNDELLRKDALMKTNFVVVPNLQLPLPSELDEVVRFDLFAYYNKYYGGSVFSSSGTNTQVKLINTDLIYQITWFDDSDIEILELSPSGILTYKTLRDDGAKITLLNIRYVVK